MGLALVDLGVVRTVRTLRRAVGVAREAAGAVQLARVGPRQLGILAGGLHTSQVARTAKLVQARLEGAGFRTATAHTMRAGSSRWPPPGPGARTRSSSPAETRPWADDHGVPDTWLVTAEPDGAPDVGLVRPGMVAGGVATLLLMLLEAGRLQELEAAASVPLARLIGLEDARRLGRSVLFTVAGQPTGVDVTIGCTAAFSAAALRGGHDRAAGRAPHPGPAGLRLPGPRSW